MFLDPVYKSFDRCKIASEPGARWIVAKITTTDVDRDGDVILPSGAETKDYNRNPIVLLGHGKIEGGIASKLPIGRADELRQHTDGISAKITFSRRPPEHPADLEWVPDTVHHLIKEDVLRGISIGFNVPIGGERMATNADLKRFGADARRVITRWKLMEISIVPMPANQNAMAVAVSKGLISPYFSRSMLNLDDTLDLIGEGEPSRLQLDEDAPDMIRLD